VLSVGSPVELEASIEGVLNWFGGTIEFSSAEALSLRFPNRGNPRPFPVGAEVNVSVIERGEVMSFDSTVTGITSTKELVVVEVCPPASYKTLGRSFFRMAWRVPVTIKWDGGGTTVMLETEDVGAGGIGVVCPGRVEVGQHATISLQLGDKGEFESRGYVVRAHHLALTEPPRYRVGLVFEDIPARARDRLMGFMLDKQREIRRRELDGG
jgi:c-di-GMP-binding flagellar brake protein YcgR